MHPEVPWKPIAGTRDKLIHFYEGVDLDEVWKMLTSDLPEPVRVIKRLALWRRVTGSKGVPFDGPGPDRNAPRKPA